MKILNMRQIEKYAWCYCMTSQVHCCKEIKEITMAHSTSHNTMSAAAKLSQDMATLINNRQGSDIQFKVGGGVMSIPQANGETIYDDSTTVTLYAHSVILRCRSRYFATMLDEKNNWKESLNAVIYKPNISPSTFKAVLHYIYTGNISAKTSESIIEMIAAADEMDLEDLSVGCQNELVDTVKHIFSDENHSNDENHSDDENESISEAFERSTKQHIPIDVAIRTHIIPALNLASSHSLSYLSQKLFTVMLPNMSVIIKSPDAYTTFVNNISLESLIKIVASDDLALAERNVWDLALSWACYQTNLSKAAVEDRLNSLEDDEENDNEESLNGTVISSAHLNQLKKTLVPLLPAIRFSLLNSDDYTLITDALNFLLPRRRFSELNRYFVNADHTGQLDTPRNVSSKIIVKSATWEFLRKSIFETGDITGCPSFKHLKFDLLFRASEHGFLASTFHLRCDNKGPTLTLVRSADGHLFGGVNFAHWESDHAYSSDSCLSNFLFALPDGHHRKNTLIFEAHFSYPFYNCPNIGPSFADLEIADSANSNENSHSYLPSCFYGSDASDTALAGAQKFSVSDYEVFAISKE